MGRQTYGKLQLTMEQSHPSHLQKVLEVDYAFYLPSQAYIGSSTHEQDAETELASYIAFTDEQRLLVDPASEVRYRCSEPILRGVLNF